MILARLKESTRSQHEALESVVDVMTKTFSIADYKDLLTRFYRFYSAVEPKLPVEGLRAAGFDPEPRRKTPLLERDLEDLGILAGVKGLGAWLGAPRTENVAEAFGSIYVMEGATLGGQIITRHLKEHLGLTPEQGGAFFNSYGPNVGRMWKEFGAAVTAYSEKHPEDDETIVNSARETFDSFRNCFEQPAIAGAALV
jgi:heme oxygenase